MILRAFVISLLFMGTANEAGRTVGLEVLHDGLVLVPVLVNGSGPYPFLLDTGGASTIVSDTLARRLRLPSAGSHRIDTVSGSRTVGISRVDELRLGGETFTGADVLWMDLASVQAGDARIQGVIGQDLLRTRSFVIDYESRRLTFDPAGVLDGQRLPLEWSDGRPLVRAVAHHAGRRADRQTSAALRFVIDSGGSHVVLFDRPAAQQLLHALRRGVTVEMTMATHAGSRPVKTATVDRVELTEETALRDVTAALVPVDPAQGRIEDGLLPASLFRAIYFDNRAGEVVLNPRGTLSLARGKGHATLP
jgi:predicted aspartyl protease